MGITYRISDTRSNCMCASLNMYALRFQFDNLTRNTPSYTMKQEYKRSDKITFNILTLALIMRKHMRKEHHHTHSNMVLNICGCIFEIKIIGYECLWRLLLSQPLLLSLSLFLFLIFNWYLKQND